MQDKEIFIKLYAFLLLAIFYKIKYKPGKRTIYILATKKHVAKAFLY